jgi:hypothetical protein
MEEAYRIIVEIAQRVCPVKIGAFYVFQEARNMFESVAERGDASPPGASFCSGRVLGYLNSSARRCR